MSNQHRLSWMMPNGLRWCSPGSGVVFIGADGDIVHVNRGVLGVTGREVHTGRPWEDDDE